MDEQTDECKYLAYFNEKTKYLDARDFTDTRVKFYEYLDDPDCPPDVKVKISRWLFTQIYMYYKIDKEYKQDLLINVIDSIEKCDDVVLKSLYLNYHDIDAVGSIALHFYKNRHNKDKFFILQLLNDTELIRLYVEAYTDRELKDHFIAWIKSEKEMIKQSNILDVLLRYYPKDPEVIAIRNFFKNGESIYDDSQSVHNEQIELTTRNAAAALIKWTEETEYYKMISMENFVAEDWVMTHFDRWYSGKDLIVAKSIVTRSRIDRTSFTAVDRTYTISDVLKAIVLYILLSEHSETLKIILMDEMIEMAELCSSGYIARFISIIQGFDDRFAITISPEDQLFAVIKQIMDRKSKTASSEVIAGTIDDDYKHLYVDFVKESINSELSRLKQDYGDDCLNLYLGKIITKSTGLACEYCDDVFTYN